MYRGKLGGFCLGTTLVCLLAWALFGQASALAEKKPDGDSAVVAMVNGESITYDSVRLRLQSLYGDLEALKSQPQRWARVFEAGVEGELRDRLLLQAALREKLEITPEELASVEDRTREMLGDDRYHGLLAKRWARRSDTRFAHAVVYR
ncbi:MAG: hypothetical protein KDH88_15830 [Chromatiales bacterium]|nr:hypothetical protein [Chromatiales bacterium]